MALLRACQPDTKRALIKEALDVLMPALQIRMATTENKLPMWVRYMKKVRQWAVALAVAGQNWALEFRGYTVIPAQAVHTAWLGGGAAWAGCGAGSSSKGAAWAGCGAGSSSRWATWAGCGAGRLPAA